MIRELIGAETDFRRLLVLCVHAWSNEASIDDRHHAWAGTDLNVQVERRSS